MSVIAARRRHRDRLTTLTLSFIDTLQVWTTRSTERRALLQLDERMLKDIGVSRVDVAREAMKPFWRE